MLPASEALKEAVMSDQPEGVRAKVEKYRMGPDGQLEATPYETVIVDRYDQVTVIRRDDEGG